MGSQMFICEAHMFFLLRQGAQDSIVGQDTGMSYFQLYDSHIKCNSTPLYHLISEFLTFRKNISSLLAVWLLKIHNKQIYHVQVLTISVQKNGRGSELFLILKINFICKYNTGWKLQKTFLKKGNIANMQKGMKGVREGRKEGKKQE